MPQMPQLKERRKAPDGTLIEWDGQGWLPVNVSASSQPTTAEPMPQTKAPTWSDRLGLNEPTASPMVGFMRGAGSGVVDLAQGAVSEVTGRMNEKLRSENQGMADARATFGNPTGITVPEKPMLPEVQQPDTFSGAVGSALPIVGEMAIGGGPPVKAAINAIPRVARAGENFQKVMGAARNVPVQVGEVGDVALRINQLAERGGSMPMAVRKLLNRLTDPNKAAMVYEESRDFASNISRLSVDEFKRLTPVVAREVASLSAALNRANAQAASVAGKGAEYAAAMNEYARAMRIKTAVDSAVRGAKKGVPIATAAGVGAWMTKKVYDAFGQ